MKILSKSKNRLAKSVKSFLQRQYSLNFTTMIHLEGEQAVMHYSEVVAVDTPSGEKSK